MLGDDLKSSKKKVLVCLPGRCMEGICKFITSLLERKIKFQDILIRWINLCCDTCSEKSFYGFISKKQSIRNVTVARVRQHFLSPDFGKLVSLFDLSIKFLKELDYI
jgi:hypothetical protein